jgi:hypothetical protein
MAYKPPGAGHGGPQYALGNWCERWSADRRCTLVSSPGAFGTYPWIDRQSGLYGIFFTRTRLPRIVDDLVRARTAILEATADATGTPDTAGAFGTSPCPGGCIRRLRGGIQR